MSVYPIVGLSVPCSERPPPPPGGGPSNPALMHNPRPSYSSYASHSGAIYKKAIRPKANEDDVKNALAFLGLSRDCSKDEFTAAVKAHQSDYTRKGSSHTPFEKEEGLKRVRIHASIIQGLLDKSKCRPNTLRSCTFPSALVSVMKARGEISYEFRTVVDVTSGLKKHTAHMVVDDKTFIGVGQSIQSAKNFAALFFLWERFPSIRYSFRCKGVEVQMQAQPDVVNEKIKDGSVVVDCVESTYPYIESRMKQPDDGVGVTSVQFPTLEKNVISVEWNFKYGELGKMFKKYAKGSDEWEVIYKEAIGNPELMEKREKEVNANPLAQWEALNSLGRGSFGKVSRGTWRGFDVALKQISCAKRDRKMMESVHKETRMMHELAHDNVTKLLGMSIGLSSAVIVMELMDCPLIKYVSSSRNKISPAQFSSMFRQISCAMTFIHSKKVVHRDLCSRNVLVRQTGDSAVYKVTDFGLAEAYGLEGEIKDEEFQPSDNEFLSVRYHAPESILFMKYSEKSDVFMLGHLIRECCSRGKSPFAYIKSEKSDDVKRAIKAVLRKENGCINSHSPRPDDCPSLVWNNVVARCWKKEPVDRPTFAEIHEFFVKYA